MPGKKTQPTLPQQWCIEPIENNIVAFNCPKCQAHYEFNAGMFENNPVEQIEGLTKSDQMVNRTFGQQFISIGIALAVFIFANQFFIEKGGTLISIVIAVVVYTMVKPLFSQGLFSGKKIPVYNYKCCQCQSEILIASNGKSQAVPRSPSDSERSLTMLESIFTDKEIQPTDNILAERIGKNFKYWSEIQKLVKSNYENTIEEWKYFSKEYGWQLNILLKKRHLFSLIPSESYFRIVFIIRDKEVEEIKKSKISEELTNKVVIGRKLAGGRFVSVDIKDKNYISDIKILIKIAGTIASS